MRLRALRGLVESARASLRKLTQVACIGIPATARILQALLIRVAQLPPVWPAMSFQIDATIKRLAKIFEPLARIDGILTIAQRFESRLNPG